MRHAALLVLATGCGPLGWGGLRSARETSVEALVADIEAKRESVTSLRARMRSTTSARRPSWRANGATQAAGFAAGARYTTRSGRRPQRSASAVPAQPIECAMIACGARPSPSWVTTARSVRANSGIEVMPRADAP